MASSDFLPLSERDTPLLAKSRGTPRMGMAEIMAWAAPSRPSFTPNVDIDMPDVQVNLPPLDFSADVHSEEPDEVEFSLPDDLIFFYRRGAIPPNDTFNGKQSLLRILQKVPFVFVLQIDKNFPIPANWISVLNGIQRRLSRKFYFACTRANGPSSGIMYIDGKLDSFFELTHTGGFVSDGNLLRDMVMGRIEQSSVLDHYRSVERARIARVMHVIASHQPTEDQLPVRDKLPDAGADESVEVAPEVVVSEVIAKPDLSSLPKADERALNGWLGTGSFTPRKK